MGKLPYKNISEPKKLTSYWLSEWPLCLAIAFTGLLYNAGMLVSPYFEGRLVDAIEGGSSYSDVVILLGIFILSMALVLTARALKRYTVRRFANNTSTSMRRILENNLLRRPLGDHDVGTALSKLIGDVDLVVEGMRKLTTELFDTVLMFVFYIAYLLLFDWAMTLYALIPVFLAVLLSFLMRHAIYKANAEARKCAGKLSQFTYDAFDNAMTYRLYGRDEDHEKEYDALLKEYEKKNVRAAILTDTMVPLANLVALLGLIPIFLIAPSKIVLSSPLSASIPNVLLPNWTLGALTSYLTTFVLMASKASKTAKLFGSIEKGLASWKRIKPLIQPYEPYPEAVVVAQDSELILKDFSLSLDGKKLIGPLNLRAKKGEIIGLTGQVASGKSAFLKALMGVLPYEGSAILFGKELRDYTPEERAGTILLMPHQNELFTSTIEENIAYEGKESVLPYLEDVSFTEDLKAMPLLEKTMVGNEGLKLSGGQQERLALARSLYHAKSLLLLDDPFASVDPKTEGAILSSLRERTKDSLVILVSHRLGAFKDLDQVVVFRPEKSPEVGSEKELLKSSVTYQSLYAHQKKGGEGA
jgi:ABC-type multidrug transport system fused ATPase/permease subunit